MASSLLLFLTAIMIPSSMLAETTVAIKGATIITMTGKTIVRGTVIIRDGKVAEIGMNVPIPEGAQVVDATGKFVMPGIIDAMSYYGIRPQDRNDVSNPVTPQNRVIQAFYPYSDYMTGRAMSNRNRELLCGGITALYIAPGNRQVIGGQGAVVKTYGKNLDDMILREPASMDISMGDSVKSAFGAKQQSPSTRMSVAALLRKTLVGAQEYLQKKEAAEKAKEEAQAAAEAQKKKDKGKKEKKKETASSQSSEPAFPADSGMEAVGRLLRKEIPARVEADLCDDIRTALRIADEFDIPVIIDSGTGAYKLRDELAERNIPVVLSPISHPFVSGEPVDYTPEIHTLRDERAPVLLAKAGVKIALASFSYGLGYTGSAYKGRWLLLEAALASGFGLSEEEALKAVTINPAEILGVSDRIGSIATGKDGDIIILSGPPLDVRTWVEQVYIGGKLVYQK